MFTVPFRRPLALANCADWRHVNIAEANILALPDAELGILELMDLFQSPRESSCFESVVYFLPHAMTYLCNTAEEEMIDLVRPLVEFVTFQPGIVTHDLTRHCRDAFIECFNSWTADFTVEHLERSVVKDSGSCRDYVDFVRNSLAVKELLCALIDTKAHVDLGSSRK